MIPITKSEVITILGSGKVGKTSIIRQFLQRTFVEKYTPTVEDTFSKVVEINNHPVTVQFIDSSGAYPFPAMRRLWIQKATAFVLVFSVTDRDSVEYLESIISEIRHERNCQEFQNNIPIVIAGNKNDSEQKCIDEEAVEDWVLNNGIPFDSLIYCSAKTNESITNLFQSLWEQRRDQVRSSQILEDLQSSCQRIPSSIIAANNPTKSKRRFSAFAILTGSNGAAVSQSTNQRRDSSTANDLLTNLSQNSPSIVRGRRGSRASITKLLIGPKQLSKHGANSHQNSDKILAENLKFDCLIS